MKPIFTFPPPRRRLAEQFFPLKNRKTCPNKRSHRSLQDTGPPFPSWEYQPAYLPDPLVMHISEARIEEPMWVYLGFMRRARREQWFLEHLIGIREITGLTLTTTVALQSQASQTIIKNGILVTRVGATPLLEIEFDGMRRNEHIDFRPYLPFIFRL